MKVQDSLTVSGGTLTADNTSVTGSLNVRGYTVLGGAGGTTTLNDPTTINNSLTIAQRLTLNAPDTDGVSTYLTVDNAANLVFHADHGSDSLATIHAASYMEKLSTPVSSSAPCLAGQFTDDADYHYVCVSDNQWKRVALNGF